MLWLAVIFWLRSVAEVAVIQFHMHRRTKEPMPQTRPVWPTFWVKISADNAGRD